jgi:predicted nucleic acid-binding protein
VRKAFIDSFHLIACENPRDDWHGAALLADDRLGDDLLRVTTHEVLLEFLAATRYRTLRNPAVETVEAIKADPAVKVIPPSEVLFERGLQRYKNRSDKEYSLVDCISMVVMEDEGITEVLTNDHHFEQEGFTLLIRR